MGWHNPPIPWADFSRMLTGISGTKYHDEQENDSALVHEDPRPSHVDGVPYAELHVHSAYSFLDGSSSPEELVEEAVRLGLSGMALTDHDGLYGAVRFAEAAARHPEFLTVYGAELSVRRVHATEGETGPAEGHLVFLARGAEGYRRLAAAITRGQLAVDAEKGNPSFLLEDLAEHLCGWVHVLTGCRRGAVAQAVEAGDEDNASAEIARLVSLFGAGFVSVELHAGEDPRDDARNDVLARLAQDRGVAVLATGNVHYARPEGFRLAQALSAVRERSSLDDADAWLPAAGTAFLHSGEETAERFRRFPTAVSRSVDIANDAAFSLKMLAPGLPKLTVPPGYTPMSWLRRLVWDEAEEKYGTGDEETEARLERELSVIEEKDFPGYFLIVRDIVEFARSRGILCQGRGSAANSAVCYVLGITAVDSIRFGLPFERFLSSMREEEPDIDVDFDSSRREEVIQYVYESYGRYNAAQVSNVISYRPKGAIRDMAKALGFSSGQQDAWSTQVERWSGRLSAEDHDIPKQVFDLAEQAQRLPRHLGIHPGGMVLSDRPVGEVCPIEHARMEGRTVLQWDKDDCAWMGLVKFDLLGLGILEALQHVFDLVDENCGERWDLSSIPREETAVYDVLCAADCIGVFQVESRAQMGMLPRLQPREFYDLVIEVALVRPGPIQGGAVHPYIKRRTEKREWEREGSSGDFPLSYLHPALEPVLKRTLGIPLFQEQLMQMAMAVGGCSAEDADQLRRSMGSKRGTESVESLRSKLFHGMAENGIHGADAEAVYTQIQAFANFGFAESHSISFALLVYASAWLKLHYPAAYLAALLRAQPMGFYAPHTLVSDAERHGVQVLHPDIQRSDIHPTLERDRRREGSSGSEDCLTSQQEPPTEFRESDADLSVQSRHRRDEAWAVRLGLAEVRHVGAAAAERVVEERRRNGPYRDVFDLARRTRLTKSALEALAESGACGGFGLSRREALWQAGQASTERPDQLKHTRVIVQPPLFSLLAPEEQTAADIWASGVSPGTHPMEHVRDGLNERGILPAASVRNVESGRRIRVAGIVTHRQRPATARDITFLNVEDETGLIGVVCSVGVWRHYRKVARESPALIVRGLVENSPEGVVNIVADHLEDLPVSSSIASRDFR